jgi:hypothetical protein
MLGRILRPWELSCVISGGGSHVVLLVGDSHADVLKRILGQEVERRGGTLRLLINHSGVYSDIDKWRAREAARSRADVFSVRLLRPQDVLREAVDQKAEKIVLHSVAAHLDVEGVRQLAEMAAPMHIQVDVLLPIPGPDFNVPALLYKVAEGGELHAPFMDSDHNLLSDADQKVLVRYTYDVGNLRVFEPRQYLCSPACRIADDLGRPYYSDSTHLTQTGVERIRPILAAIAD